jgi:hypothetical protein
MANTLHENRSGREQVTCKFGAADVRFSFHESETLGGLSARAIDWMRDCGQGDQSYIEGNPNEVIDFDSNYQILPIPQVAEVSMFLKQVQMRIRIDEPWTAFSDRLVTYFGLPRGTLFRLYPVDEEIQRIDDVDHSYTFDWVEGRQYWFDIVHHASRDPHDLCRKIRMIDPEGRLESMVIPGQAQTLEVVNLWRRMIDCPDNVTLQINFHNGQECHWAFAGSSAASHINCTLCSNIDRRRALILDGSDAFKADQLSRLLGIKMPPFVSCAISTELPGEVSFNFNGEWISWNSRVLREHELVWEVAGRQIHAPQATTWWVPYDFNRIMSYGHAVNTSIPDDPNEGKFPDQPWEDRVVI